MQSLHSALPAIQPAKNQSAISLKTIDTRTYTENVPAKIPAEMSNLAQVVYKRTYARTLPDGQTENWEQTVKRVIEGNIRKYKGTEFLDVNEEERLFYYIYNRKAMPAGRGLWFSGSEAHDKLGGAGLVNCWGATADRIENFVMAQDLLMLGGGVGMSVEHKYVSKLPRPKRDVQVVHKLTKDADFIVPDSREGWVELTRKMLYAFFVSGKGFTYSTILVRGKDEVIQGFGGKASGPAALVEFIEKMCVLLTSRAGKAIRPIDAADMLCLIGEMVVAGNVRRSALLILGDCWDKEYLKAKRWDLGVPSQRGMANFSVVCDDIEDLHPSFWETYKNGEPFGIVNRANIQAFGRMGEEKRDTAVVVNPCAEIGLENGEPCNLTELFLPNLNSVEEFKEAARLMFRWSKRVTCEDYHNPTNEKVIKKNRRVGVGITGCLQNTPLFKPEVLDQVYKVIQKENKEYSKQLGVPESIRTTTVKPSGTVSLVGDVTPGIHPAYSRHYVRRVKFAASDDIVPILREAGHHVEPQINVDGTTNYGTLVFKFPVKIDDSIPCADEDWDTWKQLEVLKMVQKHWSDNSVSVTVYYSKDELDKLKTWLRDNLSELKTISFLCHDDHGFLQAPYEPITEEEYNTMANSLKPLSLKNLKAGQDVEVDDCAGGSCPIK
jgi:adenosylcobalamin-dependent ribonucleoside-triphosphate reductase